MRIVCENLSFSYQPKTKNCEYAVKDLSLTIEEGEFFGIIGHTGSGKSTFIQHLNALVPLQKGNLFIGDYDLSFKDKKSKRKLKELRSKVGMVFQYPEYQLFAETVFEDVAFGVKNFYPELSAEEVAKKVKIAIEKVGLNYYEVKDKSPFDLSGGQKRRVAIAGILVTDPEILVLDEPVAGLDPQGKKELMELLHSFMNGKRTVIIVSHDMDEVCENCTKIAVMSAGEIISQGTPEEVFNNGKVYENLGSPLIAKLNLALNKSGVTLPSHDLNATDFINAVCAKYSEDKR